MLDYARSDTHYLLFIYDNLRNALLDRSGSRSNTPPEPSSSNSKAAAGLLLEVLARSEETSLRVYEKEVYDDGGSGPTGWDTLAKKWNRAFLMPTDAETTQRLEVYKAVHAWRDRVARLEDESTRSEFMLLFVSSGFMHVLTRLFADTSCPTTTSFHSHSVRPPIWFPCTTSSLLYLPYFVCAGESCSTLSKPLSSASVQELHRTVWKMWRKTSQRQRQRQN